jgi:hypothetical protein
MLSGKHLPVVPRIEERRKESRKKKDKETESEGRFKRCRKEGVRNEIGK